MKVKCNTVHCINFNKINKECALDKINIEFNWDEDSYGAFCSNFDESLEYKRSFYKILTLDSSSLLIIGTTIEGATKYLEYILEDIKEYDNKNIIFDDLLRYGIKSPHRFYRYKNSKLEKITLPRNTGFGEKVRNVTYEYLNKNTDLLSSSVLTQEEKRIIIKGIYL